jgi:hypothetical protein
VLVFIKLNGKIILLQGMLEKIEKNAENDRKRCQKNR